MQIMPRQMYVFERVTTELGDIGQLCRQICLVLLQGAELRFVGRICREYLSFL